MMNEEPRGISEEAQIEIRKQVLELFTRWAIAGVVALVGFAAAGWWLYFEPKIRDYIVEAAGGVPPGAILASSTECTQLSGKWATFKEGTGRFFVGAGSETTPAYDNWDMVLAQGTMQPTPISTYKIFAKGGEERHVLGVDEMPSHHHLTELATLVGQATYGQGPVNPSAVTGAGRASHVTTYTDVEGGGKSHNNIPPYLAVFYCKKLDL